MRFKDCISKDKDISFDSAQFAAVIALDQLQENEAAESVLHFLSPHMDYCDKQIIPEGCAGETILEVRANFEHYLKSLKRGVLFEFLTYVFKTEVLINEYNGNYRYTKYCSLEQLLKVTNLQKLYQKVITILFSCTEQDLINHYMFTTKFNRYFTAMMRSKHKLSADGLRKNNLSEGTIDAVLRDFHKFVSSYCSNNAYHIASCTPDRFLHHVFDKYYMFSSKKEIFNILSSYGQDTTIGANNDTTALSLVGTKGKNTTESPIDFSVFTRINEASQLLFRHASNTIAFYDIFSYHRDIEFGELKQKLNKVLKSDLLGYHADWSYGEDVTFKIEGNSSSIVTKLKGRLVICDIMEQALKTGISPGDLYFIYHDIIEATDRLGIKEGARLFKAGNISTRHRESNGEMLEVIVNGYSALQELLDFLDSTANAYGLTVHNFPTEIFRDSRYLCRFKSIDEYIELLPSVKQLIDLEHEAESATFDNQGINDNDTVHVMLSSCSILDSNSVIQGLKNKPLSYFSFPLKHVKELTGKTELYSKIITCVSGFRSIRKSITNEEKTTLYQKCMLIQQLSIVLTKRVKESKDPLKPDFINLAIRFVELLKEAMSIEGHPVLDGDNYALKEKNSEFEFAYLKELYGKYVNPPRFYDVAVVRFFGLKSLYEAFTGTKVKGSVLTYNQMRIVFSTVENLKILLLYLADYFEFLVQYGAEEKCVYLMLICAAAKPAMLKINLPFTKFSDLEFLYKDLIPYSCILDVSVKELIKMNNEKNKIFLVVVNKMLSHYRKAMETLKNISDCVYDILPNYKGVDMLNPITEMLLRNASQSLEMQDNNGELDTRSRARLFISNANCDEYGYLLRGERRFCIEGQYFHKFGYVVQPKLELAQYNLSMITDELLNSVKMLDMLKGV